MATGHLVSALSGTQVNQPTNQKLPRRPTLVRKFAETNLEDAKDPQTPSSPAKRVKVAFNNEVEINVVEEWHQAPELIREEVRRTLQRHHDGDDTQYDKLRQIFAPSQATGVVMDTSTLQRYTSAILANINLVDTSCSDLILASIKSDWLTRDDSYVLLFQKFVENLLLSGGVWLNPVLQVLVDNFLQSPRTGFIKASLEPVTPRQIRSRVHSILQSILKLIPTGSSALSQVLSTRFPNTYDSKRTHVRYVHNLLKIVGYAPELRSEISGLIIDRIVKIDVQVQVDLEDLADETGDDILRSMPTSTEEYMDQSDDESSDDSDSDSDADDTKHRAQEITANIEKLDMLLDIMFSYYTDLFNDLVTQEAAFDTLLAQFNSIMLPTYQSRHTQFLLFHFAQSSPESIDVFIGILLRIASDNTKAPLIRQTAVSYLASFVARGNNVRTDIVRDVFEYISFQLAEYRSRYISEYRAPDPRRYGTYYALCQALFYIFCFRWRDLTVSAEDDITPSPSSMLYATEPNEDTLERLTFLPIVKETLMLHCFHGLNPLKVCAPVIVTEFARITHHLQILYIYPFLEQNKRIRIINNTPIDHRETALTNHKGDTWQGLDAYFPFDPYKLPRSKHWIDGVYRQWQPIPGLDDQDQDDESDSEVEDDSDDNGGAAGTGTGTDSEDEGT